MEQEYNNIKERMKNMRKIFVMIAILSVVTMVATAQIYTPRVDNGAMQSQQLMPTGTYGGTVYEPFSTTTPSEQSAVGASHAPSGPRRVEAIGGEDAGGSGSGLVNPGDGDPGSPIGDAVVPLMLMAAAFAGVIALRRRRTVKE